MRKEYSWYQLLVTIFLILAIAGCSGDKITAPTGSVVSINPLSMSVSDTNPSATHTQYFTITIKDEKDNPVQNAEVSISLPVAIPDPLGYAQLYDGSTPKTRHLLLRQMPMGSITCGLTIFPAAELHLRAISKSAQVPLLHLRH